MKLKYSLMLLLISLFSICSISHASPSASIMYSETDLGSSIWQYDYSFYNTSDAGESLNSLWFDFTSLATVEWLSIPSGWDSTFWGFPPIPTDYLDTNSTASSYDIMAGNSITGFSFTIDYQAGDVPFTAYFSGDNVVLGTTSAIVVPEPISSTLFIIGSATLGLRRFIKRKHA